MIIDQGLIDRLREFPTHRFEGTVFRTTGPSVDPIAPSIYGGRWAPPAKESEDVSILYTSASDNGSIAEVVSFLLGIDPPPRQRKHLKVTEIHITLAKAVTLTESDLSSLGVDMSRYGERNYDLTQDIGRAINFLGHDGLIAPSARWACNNIMIYTSQHSMNEKLDVVREGHVDWQTWVSTTGRDKLRL